MAARALCVGINEFANLPAANWLHGCVNDATDLAALLKKHFGITSRNTTVLTDAQATKAAVMGALGSMVEAAKQGKVNHIVFTFSSHGTQVPDTDGDETDRLDEAFVTYDIAQKGDQWDTDTVIVDDELHALFADVPQGVLVEVLLDTCHSGTGLRDLDILLGRRPRFLPAPTPRGVAAANAVADQRGLADLAKTIPAGRRPVLFAACTSSQTASDATFERRSNGAFTYFLAKALDANPALTRSKLLTEIAAGLKGGSFTQRAQLEASTKAKRAAFGALG